MAITAEYDVTIEVANVGNLSIAPGGIKEVFGVTTAGNFGIGTVVAENTNLSLTSTSATTLATFTPTSDGTFLILCYFDVASASTTVTLTYTWTDSAGSQTATTINGVSEAVGAYSTTPYVITATTTGAINVTMTAGTANNVTASSVIIAL